MFFWLKFISILLRKKTKRGENVTALGLVVLSWMQGRKERIHKLVYIHTHNRVVLLTFDLHVRKLLGCF